MPVDSGTISGLLKRVYSPEAIEEQQNQAAPTWGKLKKAPGKPSGLGFFGAALLSGNQEGLGSQNELEGLRTSGHQRVSQYLITPKVLTDTIRLSGLSIEIAKGNEEAFANNLTFQMDSAIRDSTKELNGQIFRDGTGTLGTLLAAAVATTTLTITTPGVQWFKPNMLIDVFNAAGTVKQAAAVTVTAVDFAANTLTVTPAVTADINGLVVRANVRDGIPADGKELAGLILATDDGTFAATYESIARTGGTAQVFWRGLRFDAGAVAITNDLLQRQIMRMKVRGAEEPEYIVTHPQQTRRYLDVVTPLKRFVNSGELDSGYNKLEWNGKQWIEDTDCPVSELYMFNSKYFRRYEVYNLKFDDMNGSVAKWDPGFDAFIVYAKYYGNLGSHGPRNLARVLNLSVPTF